MRKVCANCERKRNRAYSSSWWRYQPCICGSTGIKEKEIPIYSRKYFKRIDKTKRRNRRIAILLKRFSEER